MRLIGSFAILLLCSSAVAAEDSSTCARVSNTKHTVVAFEPPSQFVLCRDGRVQRDVIAGDRLFLELLPGPAASIFEFRLAGTRSEPSESSLLAWEKQAELTAEELHQLANAGMTIDEMPAPGAVASSPLAASRSLYLSVVTSRFQEVLSTTSKQIRELEKLAHLLRRSCGGGGAGQGGDSEIMALMTKSCDTPEVRDEVVQEHATAILATIKDFHTNRYSAREALIAADAAPGNAAAQAQAQRTLDEARASAVRIIEQARALAPFSSALARDAAQVYEAIHQPDVLKPGKEVPLATLSEHGNALLQVEVRPAGIPAGSGDASMLAYRFEVVSSHYIDIEAGAGITGGVPQYPAVATENGKSIIAGRDPDTFVFLGFVELEPLRFWRADDPLAGILRFPVIGIPFSRTPSENFFVGAGLGWTGLGSITAGPYMWRETTLNSGSFGQELPSNSQLSDVTHPALKIGYFVSASVDLLGLFYRFVPQHAATYDAATGHEK